MDILPKKFWDAVLNGFYPSHHESELAFNIKDHASLIEGYSYARSLYRDGWKFYVNILAIKGMAMVSFHSRSSPEKVDAVIEYNPTRVREDRKVCDMTYLSLRAEEDPIFYQVLQQMKKEFARRLGAELFERPKENGTIFFLEMANIITTRAKWEELINTEPELTPEQKAVKIAFLMNQKLNPMKIIRQETTSEDAFGEFITEEEFEKFNKQKTSDEKKKKKRR